MNRAHFMAQLRDGLAGLHHTDIGDIVTDYERHFADGAADGRTEQEVAAALGDPARLARELRAEVGFKRWEEKRSAGNFMGVVLALLGLATIDLIILLPVLCFLAALFIGLSVACLGMVIGGSFLLFSLLWGGVMGNAPAQALIGLGLISGAVGGGALLLLVMDVIAKLLIRYARLHFRLFDSANASI
ncbi:MAG TPA: DUF1700 domain-containing protein [Rhizomicrobium sp.]